MPQNWKTYKLGEVIISANTGLDAIKRAPIVEEDTGIKCLRIQDVSQSKDFTNWGFCFVTEENFKKFALNKGEIIIARTGNTIGVNMFIHENIKAVFNNGLIRIRINKEICDAKYVFYNFRSKKFTDYIQSIAFGTSTQPNMQIGSLLNFDFFVPSLPEQTAIASILSALDDKIELNLQMNKTLEEMAMALYKHWFIDFGPFKDGEFVESELGMIPKGWEVGKLDQLIEIKYGKDHKKLDNGTIPCYGSGGIMRFVNTHLYDEESILIPRKGSLSNLFFMMKPFWSVDTMFYSKFKLPDYGKYVFHFLKTLDLTSMDVGSAIPSLTTELLNKIDLIIPPKDEVSKFNSIIMGYFNLIELNKEEVETLKIQRDSLLPKLISGEIRVKDLEKN